MKIRSWLAVAAVGLAAASPGGPQILLPLPGWTSAGAAHLVAEGLEPERGPAALLWLGRRWDLSPAPDGRLDVWLPLLAGRNLFGIAVGPEGARTGGAAEASVRLFRTRAAGDDLIVVAGWRPSGARLDLRVTDPSGEACDASSRRTELGGVRLRDDPESPGPHVFLLPRAVPGEYRVSILCGRLAPGQAVPVQALALLFPGTAREERIDLGGVVGRCDEVTDLGRVQVTGRIAGP